MCRIRLLVNFFFLPFQISNHIRKAFIFNKNEGNNQKVENKVSGRVRVRVGVGRAFVPIRWHLGVTLNSRRFDASIGGA